MRPELLTCLKYLVELPGPVVLKMSKATRVPGEAYTMAFIMAIEHPGSL